MQWNLQPPQALKCSIFKHTNSMDQKQQAESTIRKQSTDSQQTEAVRPLKKLSGCSELQGERKVVSQTFLELSLFKILFLGVPLILSLVGLYCLLKSRVFRAKILFNFHKRYHVGITNYVLVIINDGTAEIASIVTKKYQGISYHTFESQLLDYMVIEDEVAPIGSNEEVKLEQFLFKKDPLICGLSNQQFFDRLSFLGKNEHKVQIPGYCSYLFQILTQPLFMLQYLMFCIWIVQGLYLNTMGNLIFCVFVVSVNYIIQYYNYTKIKQMAEKEFMVTVCRENREKEISSCEIVPGDIYRVGREIPCDSVLIVGDLVVNQANFTGENIPILKQPIQSLGQIKDSCHWIYQGSQLLSSREGTMALAVHTGYTSHRGRIIRKIVKHTVTEPQFTHKILIFFVMAYISGAFIYLAYLSKLMSIPIKQGMVIFLLFEIVSLAVPIGYIGVVNFMPGLSLIRLDLEGVLGQQPYKVYESAQIATICFDKTGTLTSNTTDLAAIYTCDGHECNSLTNSLSSQEITRSIFACCHMVRDHEGELMGDQIDLKMFLKSAAKMIESNVDDCLWQIHVEGTVLQVLRVNQFESKHKSMSVLVREKLSGEIWVFVKGSPEMMHSISINRCQAVPQLVKRLSFEGYRTLGFGFKRISADHLQHFLLAPRHFYLEDIVMLGLVTFSNELREETQQVIYRLREEVGLQVKMITGDNIFTAVKTSFQAGIVSPDETVVVYHGHPIEPLQVTILTFHGGKHFQQKTQTITNLQEFMNSAPSEVVFAVQDSFLDSYIFDPQNLRKIRIFARITPINKTRVIREIQQNIEVDYEMRSWWQKFIGSMSSRVCMVGDGANDLMAIKQSDVGMGLSGSDSTSSADFVITSLEQIEKVIREGKSISSVLIQSLLILFINTWLYIPLTLLAMANLCTFSDPTMFYKNIAFIIPLPLLLAICKPTTRNTRTTPQMNILAPKYQLIIWINNFIFTVAFIYCFQIFWNSSEFEVNIRGWVSMKQGFTTRSKSSTLCFVLIVAHCLSVIINIYQKDPWKRGMSDNIPMSLWLLINIGSVYVVFYHQNWLGFMHLQPIGNKLATRLFIVMLAAFGSSWGATSLVYRYNATTIDESKNLYTKG